MPIKFRFRWASFFATAIVVVICVSLGQWQLSRAHGKERIENSIKLRDVMLPIALEDIREEAGSAEFRHVFVKGEFIQNWPIYLDNRPQNGEAGFYLLMPFKVAGTDKYVLIMRGWLKRDISERTKLKLTPVPVGGIEIQGVIRNDPGKVFQLGTDAPVRPHAIMQNLNVAEFAQAAKLSMYPFILQQTNDTKDGLVRAWPRPSLGIEKHLGYAFQWYALAVTAFVFFFVTGFRRGRK